MKKYIIALVLLASLSLASCGEWLITKQQWTDICKQRWEVPDVHSSFPQYEGYLICIPVYEYCSVTVRRTYEDLYDTWDTMNNNQDAISKSISNEIWRCIEVNSFSWVTK